MITLSGLSQNSYGIGGQYNSNPFGHNEEQKKPKTAYMNFFQGFNQGTGTQGSEASAIRACGNSLDLTA